MKKTVCGMVLAVGLGFAQPGLAKGEQEAIDGCIDALRATGLPDAQSGEVISSEFSEASTLVMLRDLGGSTWRCLAYSDGTVAEIGVADAADDGGGAMAGASAESGGTATEQVRFDTGTSGAELTGTLAPGGSTRYVLGAQTGQDLYVRVAPRGGSLDYQIFNPDGTFLLDMISADREYRGELWQSGDHVVEVINRSNDNVDYNVIFGIE